MLFFSLVLLPRCYSFPLQMNNFVDYLNAHGVKHGMVWLDIETNPSPGCSWGVEDQEEQYKANPSAFNSTTTGANCDYIGQLISALKARGQSVGVYASKYMWGLVAGSSCTIGSGR